MIEQTVADKEECRLQKGDKQGAMNFRGRTHAQEERILEATMRGRKPAAACIEREGQ